MIFFLVSFIEIVVTSIVWLVLEKLNIKLFTPTTLPATKRVYVLRYIIKTVRTLVNNVIFKKRKLHCSRILFYLTSVTWAHFVVNDFKKIRIPNAHLYLKNNGRDTNWIAMRLNYFCSAATGCLNNFTEVPWNFYQLFPLVAMKLLAIIYFNPLHYILGIVFNCFVDNY